MTNHLWRITYNPGRAQPYTVWRGGHVWRFCSSEEEAMAFIRQVDRRGDNVVHTR